MGFARVESMSSTVAYINVYYQYLHNLLVFVLGHYYNSNHIKGISYLEKF